MINRLLLLTGCLAALMPALLGTDIASDETKKSIQGEFPPLQVEIAETRAAVKLCKSYAILAEEHPAARSTLASVRTIVRSQLYRGSDPLWIAGAVKSPPPGQKIYRALPSIYTDRKGIEELPESIRIGFESRKTAYIELAKATQSIAELGLSTRKPSPVAEQGSGQIQRDSRHATVAERSSRQPDTHPTR